MTATETTTPVRRRVPGGSARRLTIAGIVIVAALGFLVYKGLTSAIVFFRTASQAVSQRTALGNATFQLEGTVVKGTVHRIGTSNVSFDIRQGDATIHVDNSSDPPQMFRPGLPVVLVGHFVGSTDRFASDQIMVKHSQQYIAAHPKRVKGDPGSTGSSSSRSASGGSGS